MEEHRVQAHHELGDVYLADAHEVARAGVAFVVAIQNSMMRFVCMSERMSE